MVALLALALAQQTFAPGGYSLPELCRQLSAATGIIHSPGDLRDYPVFVSVKSGDPVRIEKLVAKALRAEWFKNGQSLRLSFVKQDETEDKAIFAKQWLEATKDNQVLKLIPTGDLYNLAPGRTLRYSLNGGYASLKAPASIAALATPENPEPRVAIRRMTYNLFETRVSVGKYKFSAFSDGSQQMMTGCSDDVLQKLGADADKLAYTEQDKKRAREFIENPVSLGPDGGDVSKTDPTAVVIDIVMKPVAKAISTDLVMACPDSGWFALVNENDLLKRKVCDTLKSTGGSVRWNYDDGALVGSLLVRERFTKSQVNRNQIQRLINAKKTDGVIDMQTTSSYIAGQAVAASDSWMDAMMLIVSKITLDQSFVGDYPFNFRLYSSLTNSDWALINSEKPFSVSMLSPGAFNTLSTLLLNTRSSMEDTTPDPGFWNRLLPGDLTMQAQLSTENVLVNKSNLSNSVTPVRLAAYEYSRYKQETGKEPTYRVGTRKMITLLISREGSQEEPIKTGFTQVELVGSSKEVPYTELPADILKEFQEALKRKATPPDMGAAPAKSSPRK